MNETYIKKHWITLANLVILLTITYRVGVIQSENESGIKSNLESISRLNNVTIYHQKELKLFIPRTEIESRLKSIENTQTDIKTTQNRIYTLLLKK
jgi:hypothetical protein